MKLTDFWQRMEEHFGASYAHSWASDTVLAELDGRTVKAALAEGIETVEVWRAVWKHEGLPARDR
ncbi:MAG: hypothetical protein RL038_499 [Actinomycetota bacterium]|jgi:hypothetical protein